MTVENNYSQSFISPLQNGEGQGVRTKTINTEEAENP
jgi:hypothetical protein